MIQDKLGVESQTEASLFYAKSVQLSDNSYFGASVNAGFQGYKSDYSQLDPADPEFRDDVNQHAAIIGLGIMFYNPEKFYIGASLPRFSLGNHNTPGFRQSSYYFSAGFLQEISDDINIKPAALISYSPAIPVLADISTTVYFGTVGIGINYRSNNEVAGIFSYLFNNFRAGYSYQAGISNRIIGNYINATHELSFGFRFGKIINKVQL
jgi:type IX secretion system PorP/SprF family membrane protein